jgi:hypothetical protein
MCGALCLGALVELNLVEDTVNVSVLPENLSLE